MDAFEEAGRVATPEVAVVGSGPNGLAAAVEMARNGLKVQVFEAAESLGGGTRTLELTLPGFWHDVCSAVHPLGVSSPFFTRLPLDQFGLHWIYPESALAHPLDDGSAVLLEREIPLTAQGLDPEDRHSYLELFTQLKDAWPDLADDLLGPVQFPSHPLEMARFGTHAVRSATALARSRFRGKRAAALFAGLSAHSFLPLEQPGSAAFGLILGLLGHLNGWPVAAGGSRHISEALSGYLHSLGGSVTTRRRIKSVREFSEETVVFLDLTPRQALKVAGHRFEAGYRRQLEQYRYGPGVFKIDWALAQPIPWRARECLRAATVHVGGTLEEIAGAEAEVSQGRHPEKPFVLVAQQSLFDPSRTPEGKHTGWAYCHVPNGSQVDMTERIERQIERFAPGFRSIILAREVRNTAAMEIYNENFIGGDINGGVQDLRQIVARPIAGAHPYATSDQRIFLCSSSTPPGGGVHGMCGYRAAKLAIERLSRK